MGGQIALFNAVIAFGSWLLLNVVGLCFYGPQIKAVDSRIIGLFILSGFVFMLVALSISLLASRFVTVSYTHLDVYKRQPLFPVAVTWISESDCRIVLSEIQTNGSSSIIITFIIAFLFCILSIQNHPDKFRLGLMQKGFIFPAFLPAVSELK